MHLFVNNMVDPDITDYEFTLTTYLGDNCIVFEKFTASIGDLVVANRDYCPLYCNTEHRNVFLHIPGSKNHKNFTKICFQGRHFNYFCALVYI